MKKTPEQVPTDDDLPLGASSVKPHYNVDSEMRPLHGSLLLSAAK
jgi:hypothetical protein